MKTIYLTGHNNFNNRGCEAIVRSTIRLLNQNGVNIRFFVPSNNLKRDIKHWPNAKNHGVIFVKYKIPFFLKVLWKLQKIFNLNNFDILNYYPKSLLSIYEKVDLFLSVGGDNYSLDYTYPAEIIYQDKLAFMMKKPVILWGASVGRFDRMPYLIPKIKKHLSKMKAIYVRENISYLYLKNVLKLDNVKSSCDPAFSLLKEKNTNVDLFLNSLNNKDLIGINFSKLVLKSKDKNVNMISEIKKLVSEINEKHNMHVVFVPHVWDSYKYDSKDDYQLLKEIFKKCLKENLNVSLAPKDLNACQVKYLISHFKIFIGARMHSVIAALSLNIPTISISYSIKSEGLNDMIFGDKNLVIKNNLLNKSIVIQKIKDILKNQNYYEKILKNKNESFQKLLRISSIDLYNQIN